MAKHGSGVDNIHLAACAERGVLVTSGAGANARAVAELIVAALLALARGLIFHHVSTAAGRWERQVGVELPGKTLGLVGFGRVGREVASLVRGFGLEIPAADPVADAEAAAELRVRLTSLAEVLERADFVPFTSP